MKKILFLLGSFILFACSTKDVVYNYPENPEYVRKNRAGSLSLQKDFLIFGKKNEQKNSGNNAQNLLENSPLWHASIDFAKSESAITAADIDGGIIVTAWHQDSSDSRFKINILIKNIEAKKENLQILIFYQKKSAQGIWKNFLSHDSSKGDNDAIKIQEKILKKAL